MSVKISELPSLETLADNDILAGVDTSEDTTSKITLEKIKNYATEDVYDKEEVDNTIDALQTQIDSLSTIYNAFPTVSDEDESMTLEDTAEVTFKKLDLKGNTSQVSYSGKNLLPRFTTETISGITLTSNADGSVTLNGTATASLMFLSQIGSITEGTYYLSGATGGSSSTYKLDIQNYSSTTIPLTCYTQQVSGTISSATTYQARIVVYNGTTLNNVKIYPMLSSSGGNFEPYVGETASPNPSYPQPVNVVTGDNYIDICGKNLLPNNATSQTINGITFTINSDKSITINGTANGRADLYIYGQSTDNGNYVKIPTGIYSIDTSKITNGKLFYMFREKTAGATYATSSNSSAISLMSSQDCYFYGIVLAVENGTTLNNYTIYPMLEKGNQSTTYEPYIGNSYPITLPSGMFLGGIGNYVDFIFPAINGNSYYDSLTQAQKDLLTYGSWYLHKEIGKVVLDGSESWAKSSKTTVNRYSVGGNIINTILNQNSIDIISNYFTCITQNQSDASNIGLSKLNANGLMVNFDLSNNEFDTLVKFKTWLSTHNTIVYYVLVTPTNTEITDTTLLEQLEVLKLANSYENQTNISQENNDKPFILDVEAIKKLS